MNRAKVDHGVHLSYKQSHTTLQKLKEDAIEVGAKSNGLITPWLRVRKNPNTTYEARQTHMRKKKPHGRQKKFVHIYTVCLHLHKFYVYVRVAFT